MTRITVALLFLGLIVGCSSRSNDPRSRKFFAGESAILISDFPLVANKPESNAVVCTLVGNPGLDGRGSVFLRVGTRAEIISDDKISIMKKHVYFDEKGVASEIGENHDMRDVRVLLMDGEFSGRVCEVSRYYLTAGDKK